MTEHYVPYDRRDSGFRTSIMDQPPMPMAFNLFVRFIQDFGLAEVNFAEVEDVLRGTKKSLAVRIKWPAMMQRCPCSFPHPAHDYCDGNPNAPGFSGLLPFNPNFIIASPKFAAETWALEFPWYTSGIVATGIEVEGRRLYLDGLLDAPIRGSKPKDAK